MQLVRYDAACHAIQEARSVDEVKDWRDKAAAMQAYARMASNREMEIDAAEIRYRAERRLGEIIVLQKAEIGLAKPGPKSVVDDDRIPTLAESGISKDLSSRAQQIASIPEHEFEARIAKSRDAGEPPSTSSILKPHVSNNSGDNEWYTPREFIAAAREAMGAIHTDPASSAIANETVGAETFYTAEQDGRSHPWRGCVWMNPPYAQPLIFDFCDAVTAKFDSGEIEQACVLVNNGTETGWFQRMLEQAAAVCLIKTRVKFIDPEGKPSGAPLQGQAVIYFGDSVDRFQQSFERFGKVLLA